LATFNGERFLAPLLASIERQRVRPLELIVTDDGSTDATLTLVDEFAARAPFPLTVLRDQERLGHTENFLRGLAVATGKYAAWCDQDDVWAPEKLQRCQRALEWSGAVMVIHGARRIDAAGRRLGALRGMRTPWQRRMRGERFSVPHGFRQVFRRDLFAGLTAADRPLSIPGHEPALHDEWTFMLANAAGSVLWLPMTLADYRVHDDNLTTAGIEPTLWSQSVGARAGDPNRLRGRAAVDRAEHLEAIASKRTGDERATALASAAAYRRLAQCYMDRTALYDTAGRAAKLRALTRLFTSGTYRSGVRGGLGRRGLLRDAFEVWR
jgi:glycosyltransferase involved in cell wall biosynthesis